MGTFGKKFHGIAAQLTLEKFLTYPSLSYHFDNYFKNKGGEVNAKYGTDANFDKYRYKVHMRASKLAAISELSGHPLSLYVDFVDCSKMGGQIVHLWACEYIVGIDVGIYLRSRILVSTLASSLPQIHRKGRSDYYYPSIPQTLIAATTRNKNEIANLLFESKIRSDSDILPKLWILNSALNAKREFDPNHCAINIASNIACEYAICHELVHLLHGHLALSDNNGFESPRAGSHTQHSASIPILRHQLEFLADYFACYHIGKHLANNRLPCRELERGDGSKHEGTNLAYWTAFTLTSFWLSQNSTTSSSLDSFRENHPHPETRLIACLDGISEGLRAQLPGKKISEILDIIVIAYLDCLFACAQNELPYHHLSYLEPSSRNSLKMKMADNIAEITGNKSFQENYNSLKYSALQIHKESSIDNKRLDIMRYHKIFI